MNEKCDCAQTKQKVNKYKNLPSSLRTYRDAFKLKKEKQTKSTTISPQASKRKSCLQRKNIFFKKSY